MRPILMAIVILAAIAVGAWIWIGQGDREEQPIEPSVASVTPDEVETLSLDPESVSESGTAEREIIPSQGDEPSSLERGGSESVFSTGIRIIVLAGDGDERVPHAEVHVRRAMRLQPVTELAVPDAEVAPADWSRCDAAGECVTPAVRDEIEVVGRKDGLWGRLRWEPGSPVPVQLRLFPERLLRARVVDERGVARAGVPVALRLRGRWTRDALVARSREPDGIAEIPHIQEKWRREPGWQHFAALALPLGTPVEVPLDLDELPSDPVVLVLPTSGALEVELLGPDSHPFEYPAEVTVAVLEPAGVDERRILPGSMAKEPCASAWPAIFPHVGLGLQLDVSARSRAGYESESMHVFGPGAPGQRVRAALRLEPTMTMLVGRLVTAESEPHRSIPFRVSGDTDGLSFSICFASDEDGRFHAPLEPMHVMRLDSVQFSHRRGEGQSTLRATEVLPPSIAVGIVDLGDVVLREPPVLASGTLVDEEGTAIPNAVVHAVESRPPGERARLPSRISGLVTSTNADGGFSLAGWVDTPTVTLLPQHDSFPDPDRYPQCVEVPIGSAGVSLVLPSAGEIAGNLLVDDGVPPRRIRVIPWHPDSVQFESSSDPRVAEDGTFSFPNLAPGSYIVLIGLRRDELLLHVDGVVVRSGEVTRDPRLQDIDLRGRVRAFRIKATGSDDTALEGCTASFRQAGNRKAESRNSYARDGVLCIVTRDEAVDVVVKARGYRSRELLDVHSDDRVVLQPGPRSASFCPIRRSSTARKRSSTRNWNLEHGAATSGSSSRSKVRRV